GLAGRQPVDVLPRAQGAAGRMELGAGRLVDGAVDATAAQQGGVGRVDHGVHLLSGDVAEDELDPWHARTFPTVWIFVPCRPPPGGTLRPRVAPAQVLCWERGQPGVSPGPTGPRVAAQRGGAVTRGRTAPRRSGPSCGGCTG